MIIKKTTTLLLTILTLSPLFCQENSNIAKLFWAADSYSDRLQLIKLIPANNPEWTLNFFSAMTQADTADKRYEQQILLGIHLKKINRIISLNQSPAAAYNESALLLIKKYNEFSDDAVRGEILLFAAKQDNPSIIPALLFTGNELAERWQNGGFVSPTLWKNYLLASSGSGHMILKDQIHTLLTISPEKEFVDLGRAVIKQ